LPVIQTSKILIEERRERGGGERKALLRLALVDLLGVAEKGGEEKREAVPDRRSRARERGIKGGGEE